VHVRGHVFGDNEESFDGRELQQFQ
jgi:hypothetical protein